MNKSTEWPEIQQMDPDELIRNLQQQADRLGLAATALRENYPRTERNLVVHNLIRRAAVEMRRAADSYPPIDVIAWCTRNIFELYAITSAVIASDEHLNAWIGQIAQDEIDVIDGFIASARDPEAPEVENLRKRRSDVEALAGKHDIKPTKNFNMLQLAEDAGMATEYRALYKLSSKFIHPSSWLVNLSSDQINASDKLDILVVSLQIYAEFLRGRYEMEYSA